MEPVTLPTTSHYRGDLWRDGYRHFKLVDTDGIPVAIECKFCRIQFRNEDGEFGYELNSSPVGEQGLITIVDGVGYEFDIPAQGLPLLPGTYDWDFETYTTSDASDYPITWFRGKITVLQDVSHD